MFVRVTRVDGHGTCESCGHRFPYGLVHNGFSDTCHAYCDRCGRTALVSLWSLPDGLDLSKIAPMPVAIEALLAPCVCGGRFDGAASPRCPSCARPLSAEDAREWIERDAPGTRVGYRWQRSWIGLYAIVVDGQVAHDPLR